MRILNTLIVLCFLFSCKKDSDQSQPSPPQNKRVLLKDIVQSHLPSPFYHFEYDADKQVVFASFASDLNRYTVLYHNGKIDEMRNNIIVNKDRIQYKYGDDGNVSQVIYADSTGSKYIVNDLFYNDGKLISIQRSRKIEETFVRDKVTSFSYHSDGNLSEITYHYLPVDGIQEQISTSHFDGYDNKVNVDCFDLIHNEFFDHLFLLPDVQLMKNNPRKEVRTGDGINYTVDYTYTYNEDDAPSAKKGKMLVTNGADAGKWFDLSWFYTFY